MADYRIFWAKARENLAAAECEFGQGRHNACANRAYYAMFHAAVAALLAFGVQPPGARLDHGWVQAAFNERLIKRRKVYPASLAPELLKVMAVRDTADYRDEMISRKVANRVLRRARNFVETISEKLEEGQR